MKWIWAGYWDAMALARSAVMPRSPAKVASMTMAVRTSIAVGISASGAENWPWKGNPGRNAVQVERYWIEILDGTICNDIVGELAQESDQAVPSVRYIPISGSPVERSSDGPPPMTRPRSWPRS